MNARSSGIGTGALLLALTAACGRAPRVEPNDNRAPAGAMAGDTLRLHLVVVLAEWFPGADDGPSAVVPAFAEEGRPPRVPGPLIRVREGTVLDVVVRNGLADSVIHVLGLVTRPAEADARVTIAPGDSARVRFAAGRAGTYLYRAVLGAKHDDADPERETAAGAFVVDPAGGSPPDRVFVMNIWSDPVDSVRWREALAINGRSFPYTERLTEQLGDSIRWRWINASVRNHPMHLHGFYFRVRSTGDAFGDTAHAPQAQRLVVTETMLPFSTMAVAWQPDRVGNWLFHCHIGFHVSPEAQLEPPPDSAHAHTSGDFARHMAGLVLAMTVEPPPGYVGPDAAAPQRRHLFVQEGRPRGRAARALGYVLGDELGRVPAPDSVDIPGRVLVLTRGRPADVMVVNRLREPTAVHWHGLELDSWSDGMAGWSGMGRRVAPPVMPQDSFTARLLLPRAGTFMYHTHLNDHEQLTSGLYGALLVLEPGERYDPAVDHVYVVGWDGPGEPIHFLLNGDSVPAPATFRAGRPHRMRFINIGPAGRVRFSLLRDTTPVAWRALAFDGADLPAALAVVGPAAIVLDVGQTADFELTPGPGAYRLMLSTGSGRQILEQKVVVR